MEINNQEKTIFMNIENSTDNYSEKGNQIKKKENMSITYKLPRQKCQMINDKKKKNSICESGQLSHIQYNVHGN